MQPTPGSGAFRFSLAGPVIAAVTAPNGTVDIRTSTGRDAFVEVVPENASPEGQAEAAALLVGWTAQGGELTEAELTDQARPECRFDIPADIADVHPMRIQLWLPAGSGFSVATENATVSAEGSFTPSRVSSDAWLADIRLEGTDKVTTRWEQADNPTRTVLSVEGGSGSVTVARSGCDLSVDIDGPVTLRNVHGDVDVVNKRGHTRVEDIIGTVRAQSDTGDLTARNVVGRVDFHTTSGTRDLSNVGPGSKHVRLVSPLLANQPADAVESTLKAVAAAETVLNGAAKRLSGPPSGGLRLPVGTDEEKMVKITFLNNPRLGQDWQGNKR